MSKHNSLMKKQDDEVRFVLEEVKAYFHATIALYRRTTDVSYVLIGAVVLVLTQMITGGAPVYSFLPAGAGLFYALRNLFPHSFYSEGESLKTLADPFFDSAEQAGMKNLAVFSIEEMDRKTQHNDRVNRKRMTNIKRAILYLVLGVFFWFLHWALGL